MSKKFDDIPLHAVPTTSIGRTDGQKISSTACIACWRAIKNTQ